VPLVPDRRGGGEDERPRHHGEDKGKAEKEEGIPIEVPTIECSKSVLIGARAKFLGLEDWHDCVMRRFS